jgi:hypothetical protein
MIGIVRDTWRAVLVVVVAILLREVFAERPAAAPAVATQWHPVMPPPIAATQEPSRPLRRVGEAFVDLADSVIGVIRRGHRSDSRTT